MERQRKGGKQEMQGWAQAANGACRPKKKLQLFGVDFEFFEAEHEIKSSQTIKNVLKYCRFDFYLLYCI